LIIDFAASYSNDYNSNQYDKLKNKDKQKILAPMCKTLKDQSIVISDNGTKLFCKEFSRQEKKIN
jgi:hypothetical protein